jgi:hypothetical protein
MNNKKTGIDNYSRKKKSAAAIIDAGEAIPQEGDIADSYLAKGCRKKCIYRMMENNPEWKDIISKAREMIVVEAEKSLLKSIRNGNVTSIIFALKTLGRSRGYVQNGYKPQELAARINQAVLKKLTDEQLTELESLLKQKKNLASFLKEIGLDAASD